MAPSIRRRLVLLTGLAGAIVASVLPATATCPADAITRIEPGETIALPAVAASCNGMRFVIEVPDGILRLEAGLRGGEGNPDLFLAHAGAVSTATPQFLSASPSVRELISVDAPTVGDWFLLVRPTADFAGTTLRVELTAEETFVAPGLSPRELAAAEDGSPRFRFFTLEVPPGSRRLSVRTSGGSGDVDLFVRPASLPTEATYAAASKRAGNDEGVDIPTPAAGSWKVGLLRSQPYDGVDLDVEIESAGECEPDANTLCLLAGRFRVRVAWRNVRDGATGQGFAVRDTDRTGAYYFFRRDNTELFVKMLDGRSINGSFWIFWSGLTDLEYQLEVFDTETEALRTYQHAAGDLSGGVDTSAFPVAQED